MKLRKITSAATAGQLFTISSAWSFSNLMMTGSKANHVFSESVAVASKKGLEECQQQFTWDRWNCPKSSFNIFSKYTSQPATREMAFLHAMVSAAIVVSLTRNCSMGHFKSCGCDETKRGSFGYKGWSWGGCSDNVKFGKKIAKEFLDSRESAKDSRALVNLHNNQVGRSVVKRSMKQICKCHGVSGSCATKTCWMRLADLRHIGNILKKEYESSVRVEFNGHGNLLQTNRRRKEARMAVAKLGAPRHHLIYMENSPDYCIANASAGAAGTLGRECSRRKGPDVSNTEKASCKNLCRDCGLKVVKKLIHVTNTCNCKFHWCCHVKCEECKKSIVKHICQ